MLLPLLLLTLLLLLPPLRWQKATISYGSKKQSSIATSSCHAEIIAASETAKEAKFYREFIAEMGVQVVYGILFISL